MLYQITKEVKQLEESIRGYERGFYIRNGHGYGINYAFLINFITDQSSDRAEAIADFGEARRVRGAE